MLTFKELQKIRHVDLIEIRKELRKELAAEIQKHQALMGEIMFLEREIKKYKDLTDA